MKVRLRSKTIAEVIPAAGIKGWLMRDTSGRYFFRVYDDKDKRSFHDYDIRIFDLEVTISPSSDAAFYATPRLAFLDHNPQTLRLEEVKDEG